ncbi:MAG: FAD-dependent oxidoreductase [Desulfobacterales bacterium]|jgi:2,4-dienoyl-CoA reductase (NADPH2)
MYPCLFSPIRINTLEIKNRIAYPSLGLLYSTDGKLNDRYYNYFAERAKGGAGLVTVGPVGVDYVGSGAIALSLTHDEAIADFRKLTAIIKDGGARAWIQLFHAGAYSHPMFIGGQQPMAPSAVYSRYSQTTPREMTIADIKQAQKNFAQAAVRAKEAGFDGVEILASAGYLISQFLSERTNQRTDDYGGSFENRVRFPRELIELLRKRLGPEYPLTIRMAGNDFVRDSNTDTDTPEFARIYEKAGVDAINVTGGWHESRVPQLPMHLPRAAFAFLSLNIKKAVSVPIIASNRISDPDKAEQIIKDGYADMVNLGRVLIADPLWPQKAFEGKAKEIRPCVGCSQGCTDQVFSGRPVFCVGNARAGFEGERRLTKTDHPKKVMVVGAGASGLEAAITAATCGHQVDVFEKDSDIGGQLWIAGAPPHKQEILEFIRYYRAQIKKHQIPLHLNTAIDADFVQQQNPDYIILAEGAEPSTPQIDGYDDPCVFSAWQVLKENPALGKSVAVIGGGSVGLETALFVATKGTLTPETLHFLFTYEAIGVERLRELLFRGSSKVTVFEMLPRIGQDIGKSTRWIVFDNLKRYGVKVKTSTRVTSIRDGIVIFEKEDQTKQIQFDNVILASGAQSVAGLSAEIKKLGIPFATVGDGLRLGKLNDAIHGGFLAALSI